MKPRSKRRKNNKRKRNDENVQYKVTIHDSFVLDGKDVLSNTTNVLIRTIEPYLYTFATYAKARWIGRTVYDVYCTEFGSYPSSYYKAAIEQGRITISDNQVALDYTIRNHDLLSHTVHRHEPAVFLTRPRTSAIISNTTTNIEKNTNIITTTNNNNNTIHSSSSLIPIIADTSDLIVVNKPCTLPIHSCGAYYQNALIPILERQYQQKLYTIQRLDRLTSGLVLLGKSSTVAQTWGKVLMNRNENTSDNSYYSCSKIYVARVRGKFPLNMNTTTNKEELKQLKDSSNVNYGNYSTTTTTVESNNSDKSEQELSKEETVQRLRLQNTLGYWITTEEEDESRKVIQVVVDDDTRNKEDDKTSSLSSSSTSLEKLFDYTSNIEEYLSSSNNKKNDNCDTSNDSIEISNNDNKKTKKKRYWFHIACPTRIAKPKDGICEAGSFKDLDDDAYRKSVKAAQTSFAIVRYDSQSDTTVLICKPQTGRTHQIRLHLQYLNHPIANDTCYNISTTTNGTTGNNKTCWYYGNKEAEMFCNIAKRKLQEMTKEAAAATNASTAANVVDDNNDNNNVYDNTIDNSIIQIRSNADTPASEQEINDIVLNKVCRKVDESFETFIKRTCVWCARSNNNDTLRTILELLIRSRGIWLHALRYTMKYTTNSNSNDDSTKTITLDYSTDPPDWC